MSKFTVSKTPTLKPAKTPLRKSKYDDLISAIGKLKPGGQIEVPLPAGVDARKMQVRLTSIRDRRIEQGLLKLPKGYRLSHFATDRGTLAIELKKIEAGKATKKKTAKKKTAKKKATKKVTKKKTPARKRITKKK